MSLLFFSNSPVFQSEMTKILEEIASVKVVEVVLKTEETTAKDFTTESSMKARKAITTIIEG